MIGLLARLLGTAAVVALVLATPFAYGRLVADSKIDPELQQQLGDGSYAYSVQVDLDFPPEYFHIRKLQAIGTVAGIQGNSVRVLQLTPDEVHEIAQLYWVKRLEPFAGPKP